MSRDLPALRDRLAQLLPDGKSISGITAFSTGHSNETYLIQGLDQILRLPPTADPLMPDTHAVPLQGEIYRALAQPDVGFPVPRILFQCDDATELGDPFFVMERIAGEEVNDYRPQSWFLDADTASRGDMCRQWIDTWTGISRMPPLEILGSVVSPEEEAKRWRGWAEEGDCERLVAQFDQLLAIPAPLTGRPSPVHGDPKFANLMWDRCALTAVLDWELAYNGDPLADLGYILFFFTTAEHPANGACTHPGMWTRDEVISHWEKHTGRSAAGVYWHEIAAVGKMTAIIAYGHNLYVSGKSDDERFLQWKRPLDGNMDIIDAMLAKL